MKLTFLVFLVFCGLLIGCKGDHNERLRLESINKSLENANEVISGQMDRIYDLIIKEASDARYHNTATWQPLADSVRRITLGVNEFVDSLIAEIKVHSEGGSKDLDRDGAQQIIEKEGKGKLLYDSLIAFRWAVLNLFSPEKLETYPDARAYMANELAKIEKLAPINLTLFADTAALMPMNISDWSAQYFSKANSLEALTVLNKIKNDVLSTGIMLIRFSSVHIWERDYFERFSDIVVQSSNYLKKGDSLEITAGVGAFSLIAKPTFIINGVSVTPGDEGAAIYKMRVTGKKGLHTVPVKVEFIKPDGSTATFIKKIKYTVVE